jgi:hypothetical protein
MLLEVKRNMSWGVTSGLTSQFQVIGLTASPQVRPKQDSDHRSQPIKTLRPKV